MPVAAGFRLYAPYTFACTHVQCTPRKSAPVHAVTEFEGLCKPFHLCLRQYYTGIVAEKSPAALRNLRMRTCTWAASAAEGWCWVAMLDVKPSSNTLYYE